MKTEPLFGLNPRQYSLRALLVVTALTGVIMALGRWAGDHRKAFDLATACPGALPTGWALSLEAWVLAFMIAVAAARRRLGAMFLSTESLIFVGGAMMLASGFFCYDHGSWIDINLYGILTCCWAPSELPLFLAVWPMAYGIIAATASFAEIIAGETPAKRWRFTVAGVFLAAAAATTVAVELWPHAWWRFNPDGWRWTISPAIPCMVLASLAATFVLVRYSQRSVYFTNLIATIWLTSGLAFDPHARAAGFLRTAGPGFWLLVVGDLLVLVGSAIMLWSTAEGRRRVPTSSPSPGTL